MAPALPLLTSSSRSAHWTPLTAAKVRPRATFSAMGSSLVATTRTPSYGFPAERSSSRPARSNSGCRSTTALNTVEAPWYAAIAVNAANFLGTRRSSSCRGLEGGEPRTQEQTSWADDRSRSNSRCRSWCRVVISERKHHYTMRPNYKHNQKKGTRGKSPSSSLSID